MRRLTGVGYPSKTRGSLKDFLGEWKHPWRGSPRLSARNIGAEEGSIS